ncbi:MAG: xanthine dehydrogenase family protein subunit M [Gammaproteobacteria bacterium]|nr:xanthine dehydrogenase family protein subunit M [Gammaproteobacteria bacterium]
MFPAKFDFHAPASIDEALSLLSEHGDEAKVLAGGHSLLPMMKMRFATPQHVLDLNGINNLRGISHDGDTIVIGAMTTENQIIASDVLAAHCPLLPEAAKQIGDPQVRNRGTIGGDICHGDPANDQPAVTMAADATYVLQGPNGERSVHSSEFFLGSFYTAMEANEVMTAIMIPVASQSNGSAYVKLKRKTGDWATAAAAVQLTLDGNTCSSIRIALTNVGPTPMRVTAAERALTGKSIDEGLINEAADHAMAACEPAEDLRGDVEYKTHMAGEMTRRAIRQSLARAGGQ